jgi:hypothetical protein
MVAKKRIQFIDTQCGTQNPHYRGKACLEYNQFSQECRLLRTQQAEKLWDKTQKGEPVCRCAFEIFYTTVNTCNAELRRQYCDLPVDEAEDLNFDDLIRRAKMLRLEKGVTLVVWRKYVSKIAYREIKKILVKQGLLPEKKKCGSCKYLPKFKPYICSQREETRKRTDTVCDTYNPSIGLFLSIDDDHDQTDPGERRKIDQIQLEMLKAENEQAQATEEINFRTELDRLLRERADSQPYGSVKRKICRRQYDVFISIMALLSEGIPKEEVEQTLAKRHRLKDARTIRRDLEEIRKFLKNNVRKS